jgi:hypothetical protein
MLNYDKGWADWNWRLIELKVWSLGAIEFFLICHKIFLIYVSNYHKNILVIASLLLKIWACFSSLIWRSQTFFGKNCINPFFFGRIFGHEIKKKSINPEKVIKEMPLMTRKFQLLNSSTFQGYNYGCTWPQHTDMMFWHFYPNWSPVVLFKWILNRYATVKILKKCRKYS